MTVGVDAGGSLRNTDGGELIPVSRIVPDFGELAVAIVAGGYIGAVLIFRQRVPFLRHAVVFGVVAGGDGAGLPLEVALGVCVDLFEKRQGVRVRGVEMHVEQAADEFVVGVVAHAGVAIGVDGFGPLSHQAGGFVADLLIAGSAVEAGPTA